MHFYASSLCALSPLHAGGLAMAFALSVFVIGLLVFTVQMQFNAAQSERLRMEQQHATDVGRIERMLERRGITQ